ncbi:MAG: lytic murein transglycosylase B [Burkholderiales bacterium]|nr:lytic murein transglycosylase B [Burkholderiales bacterium]
MIIFLRYFLAVLAFGVFCFPAFARAHYDEREDIQSWIADFARRENINPEYLSYYLQKAQPQSNVLSLMDAPIKAPLSWNSYAPRFLNEGRIDGGVLFWMVNKPYLEQASRFFGVPQEIIVAIIGIETHYGRNMGKFPVLDTLSTLAFDYPRRADYFRAELEHFFLLSIDNQFEITQLRGSYAGAMGIAQFMPRSYRYYAVDFDGDGKINLWQTADAIGSIGFYLHEHGWKHSGRLLSGAMILNEAAVLPLLDDGFSKSRSWKEWRALGVILSSDEIAIHDDESVSLMALEIAKNNTGYYLAHDNFHVVMRYNKSYMYATAVAQLARAIAAQRYR